MFKLKINCQMEFGENHSGSPDQNKDEGENRTGVIGSVNTTEGAEAPLVTNEFDNDMRQDLTNRGQNITILVEGVVDASLVNQLEGEITTFREALREVVRKVEHLSAG